MACLSRVLPPSQGDGPTVSVRGTRTRSRYGTLSRNVYGNIAYEIPCHSRHRSTRSYSYS
eukprot:scaffold290378_cov16-Prasinocladus_malaysianus.AAC.1